MFISMAGMKNSAYSLDTFPTKISLEGFVIVWNLLFVNWEIFLEMYLSFLKKEYS